MSFGNFDLSGSDKLIQMEVFADMFHKSAFGKFLCRRDGSFIIANNTLSYKLRIPEAGFNSITLNDLLFPNEVDDSKLGFSFNKKQHDEWFDRWFDWPFQLRLEKRKNQSFKIWGYGEPNYRNSSSERERVPHDCIVVVKPVYWREIGKMIIPNKEDSKKEVLAFGSVIFKDDFQSMQY